MRSQMLKVSNFTGIKHEAKVFPKLSQELSKILKGFRRFLVASSLRSLNGFMFRGPSTVAFNFVKDSGPFP
jgi:hypothetical protein